MTTELYAKEIIFHFNKKHLEDPTIPMWVIKAKGETYYVKHLDATVPWSTKETPKNDHTKGSIKFKNAIFTINDDNYAKLRTATQADIDNLKHTESGSKRILINQDNVDTVVEFIAKNELLVTPALLFHGECGEKYFVFDILTKEAVNLFIIGIPKEFYQILPREDYFFRKYADKSKLWKGAKESNRMNLRLIFKDNA